MPEALKDVVAQLRVRGFFNPSIKEVEDTVRVGEEEGHMQMNLVFQRNLQRVRTTNPLSTLIRYPWTYH